MKRLDIRSQVITSPAETALVIEQYKDLLNSDRTLLVPILGSLSDLPLSNSLKEEVFELTKVLVGLIIHARLSRTPDPPPAQESLALVDEPDIPTVIRALLRMTNRSTGPTIVTALRQEFARMSGTSRRQHVCCGGLVICSPYPHPLPR